MAERRWQSWRSDTGPKLEGIDPVIGHRGAKTYAPENTLASIRCARELGCRWVELDVNEAEVRFIARGQAVRIQSAQLSTSGIAGTVIWIDSELDERTRTVHVRAPVENPAGLLRANLFVTGVVEIEAP